MRGLKTIWYFGSLVCAIVLLLGLGLMSRAVLDMAAARALGAAEQTKMLLLLWGFVHSALISMISLAFLGGGILFSNVSSKTTAQSIGSENGTRNAAGMRDYFLPFIFCSHLAFALYAGCRLGENQIPRVFSKIRLTKSEPLDVFVSVIVLYMLFLFLIFVRRRFAARQLNPGN